MISLGTGSGAWCVQMAAVFPHADVVGGMKTVLIELPSDLHAYIVDLVVNSSRTTPANCRWALSLLQFSGNSSLGLGSSLMMYV